MSTSFDDSVLDYVLGLLGGEELAEFERQRERSPALRASCREAVELLALSTAALPPVAPPPDLKHRILAATIPSAWEALLDRVARVWDLSVAEARRTFGRAMDPAEWGEGPLPGTRLFHLAGGPAVAGADVGIVDFAPGLHFPRHGHGGTESYVVLEGTLHDSSGTVEVAGDVVTHGADEVHSFVVGPEGARIAIVLMGDLQFAA